MTDYAAIGASRVRHCHCHDEPWSSEPVPVPSGAPNPARFSSAGQTFVRALFGSIRGRFAQMPMLIGGSDPIGVTQGTPLGVAFGGGELIMNSLNPQRVTHFGGNAQRVTRFGESTTATRVDDSPLGRVEAGLGKVDDALRPYGALAGFAAGVLGTWMVLDAVQASKNTTKFNAGSSAPAAGDRSRRRRRRWF